MSSKVVKAESKGLMVVVSSFQIKAVQIRFRSGLGLVQIRFRKGEQKPEEEGWMKPPIDPHEQVHFSQHGGDSSLFRLK